MVNIVIQRGGIDGSQAIDEIVSDVIIRRGRGRVGRAIHGAGSRGKRTAEEEEKFFKMESRPTAMVADGAFREKREREKKKKQWTSEVGG